MEGVNGLMFAADVEGDGHFTEYPSDKPSVALQIPFKDAAMPEHNVFGDGPCDAADALFDGSDSGGAETLVNREQVPMP